MLEKYETPEVEFVEMEEEDVMCASSCDNPNGYGNNQVGNCACPYTP